MKQDILDQVLEIGIITLVSANAMVLSIAFMSEDSVYLTTRLFCTFTIWIMTLFIVYGVRSIFGRD